MNALTVPAQSRSVRWGITQGGVRFMMTLVTRGNYKGALVSNDTIGG